MTAFIQTQFATLFAYHWHTTLQLLDAAQHLDESAGQEDPGYGHGSIQGILFHLLRTDRNWRLTLQTGRPQSGLNAEDYPSLEALRAGFLEEQRAWQDLLAGYTPEQIEGDLSLTNYRGEASVIPGWRVLQHLILHGMQHHSELAQLLTARGQSPGNIDFIFYE